MLFTRKLGIKKVDDKLNIHRQKTARSTTHLTLVSFAAVFGYVTERLLERGALRDILKDGCEGD